MKQLMQTFLIIESIFHCLANTLYSEQKLNIHGQLTQAYAITDKHQIFGIPKNGTFQYRNLALQVRYDYDDNHSTIIQLCHKHIGESPVMKLEHDIELDWGFFQYKITDNLTMKVGKIQLPFGIFNEIRDVGTLFPFFSLPYSLYGEGNYMSETVDGVSVSYAISYFSPWTIDVDLYGGHWNWIEWHNFPNPITNDMTTIVDLADINNGFGSQLWFGTPVHAIKLGCGGNMGHVSNGINFQKDGILGDQDFHDVYLSIDANFEKFYVRTEGARLQMHTSNLNVYRFYSQSGIKLFDQLSMNTQYDLFSVRNVAVFNYKQSNGINRIDFDYLEDASFSINYLFDYNIILKLETHFSKGYLVEDELTIPTLYNPFTTWYGIISLATSF